MTDYDSTSDTINHSQRVAALIAQTINELTSRSAQHDMSKLEPPELDTYNKCVPLLQQTTYGSPEYRATVAQMGDGLAHHYAANRHHPEHYTNGVNDMTLVDLVEMLADWKAASERGNSALNLNIQRERFGISDQLAEILANTATEYGWL